MHKRETKEKRREEGKETEGNRRKWNISVEVGRGRKTIGSL